ncbi:unnamed protein product [Blepharisma stoltei]|uniref:Uncharacterized protein n=1 Tax=Blepharisma stoltei TaxID=1481888 RepID=A0AAU9JEX9_9CILI|nr:unnamed protein product [Blepharisma stoltei]
MASLSSLQGVIDMQSLLISEHKRLHDFMNDELPQQIDQAVNELISKIRAQADSFHSAATSMVESKIFLIEEAIKLIEFGSQLPDALNFPIHMPSSSIFRAHLEVLNFKFDINNLMHLTVGFVQSSADVTLPENLKPVSNYYRRTEQTMNSEVRQIYKQVLESRGELNNLTLNNNPKPLDCQHLGFLLSYTSNLKILNLDSKNIGPSGVLHLAKGLKDCTTLELLNLRSNNIGPDGAAHLSAALSALENLKSLYLTANSLGDEGVSHLIKAFPSLLCLNELSLSANMITVNGAICLSKSLDKLSNLGSLNLSDNYLGKGGIAYLSKKFVKMPQLGKVFIGGNAYGCEIEVHKNTKVLFY